MRLKVSGKKERPRWDLNPQPSDPKSDALSITPLGLSYKPRHFVSLKPDNAWSVAVNRMTAKMVFNKLNSLYLHPTIYF